jgi:preflagellin peptidase FlaK
MLASVPDLLRLLVVPLLGWAAWRDVRTRRVPNRVWYPPAALGVALLGWELWTRLPMAGLDDRLFLIRVAVSLGFVLPLSFAFWWFGAFGGADAKAFMTVAVLFPTYPTLYLSWTALPLVETTLGVFSLTVLTNTVLLGLGFPLVLAARNLRAGEVTPAAFLARRAAVTDLPACHGKLFEDPDGFTRRGLDLDALRMYLRWRGTTLAAVRAAPATYRDPTTVGDTAPPGDGRVAGPDVAGDFDAPVVPDDADDAPVDSDTGDDADPADPDPPDDPWAAERFLASVDGPVYGTTPETLRDGLEVVADRDEVWISPGLPFIVPLFAGLLVAVTYGDLLFGVLIALGLV